MSGTPRFAQSINYGGGITLRHIVLYAGEDKSSWDRTIVEFDVAGINGAKILGAKLVREITSLANGGHLAILSRCTRPDEWIESEVTWLSYKTGAGWITNGGDIDDAGPPAALTYSEPATTGLHELTGLSPFVEDALENRAGIVSLVTRLKDEDPEVDTGTSWFSREHAQSWRLVVEYALPDPGRRSIARSSQRGSASALPARPHSSARPRQPMRRRR